MIDNFATRIIARGSVVADYDTVQFALTFSAVAPKSKEAKEKLTLGVKKISSAIEILKNKGLTMSKSTFFTNSKVEPNVKYNRSSGVNETDGQKATYILSFQTNKLDMVNDVYDTLSDIDLNEYTLSSPVYSVKAVSDLKHKALEDAWKVSKILFENQCNVIGVPSTNYTLKSWDVDYSGYSGVGKGRNSLSNSLGGGSGDSDGIEINPGKSVVEVVLTVYYI